MDRQEGRADVLHFARPSGWEVITNFGTEPYSIDPGPRLITSSPTLPGTVRGETTAWVLANPDLGH